MATLRDIKRRITSVSSTQQITKAMKMIAAAKLNRAKVAVESAQPYSEKLRGMVTALAGGLTADDHPLFEQKEGGKTVALLFTSDRGLCGGFNNNLNRLLYAQARAGELGAEPEVVIFGRTGNDFFRRRELPVTRALVQIREADRRVALKEVIGEIVARFLSGEVGRVHLAFNRFINAIRQTPLVLPLLPIAPPAEAEANGEAEGQGSETVPEADDREALFEPSRAAILDSLLPKYLENQALLAHLNTEAGEHGARMVAMEAATKNAGEMIDRLTLQYNRMRQAVITRELIEIINGAQAV